MEKLKFRKDSNSEWQDFSAIKGADGKNATVNGLETINILAGENITLDQTDNNLTINADVKGYTGDKELLETENKTDFVGAINEIYNHDVYSSSEQVIGKWVDDKTLYRKIIEIALPSPSEDYTLVLENVVENLDTITNMCGTYIDGNNIWHSLNNNLFIKLQYSNLYIKNTDVTSGYAKLILEYTKATD